MKFINLSMVLSILYEKKNINEFGGYLFERMLFQQVQTI